MRWYMPTYGGDFRLVPCTDGNSGSMLIIHRPTMGEIELLQKFLVKARKKGWTDQSDVMINGRDGTPYRGNDEQHIPISAPVSTAGAALAAIVRPRKSSITAFKYSHGRMEITEGTEALPEAAAAAEAGGAEAAASVKRPTPSCPQCVPGAVGPASEVLLEFLTPQQHEDWARDRAIIAYGGYTGHRYLLAHRHTAAAQRIGRICYDLDSKSVIHFHDNMVPPEEEVLAAKLILEHREDWLRNEATLFGMSPDGSVIYPTNRRTAFKNPFGDVFDGVVDAALTQTIGNLAALAAGMVRS